MQLIIFCLNKALNWRHSVLSYFDKFVCGCHANYICWSHQSEWFIDEQLWKSFVINTTREILLTPKKWLCKGFLHNEPGHGKTCLWSHVIRSDLTRCLVARILKVWICSGQNGYIRRSGPYGYIYLYGLTLRLWSGLFVTQFICIYL